MEPESAAQSARETLDRFAASANSRLGARFDEWRSELPSSSASPSPVELLDAVADLTLRGGKRLRPALVYYTALCFEHGLPPEALLDAALSVELLQTALLIHDDIMDRDAVRRGGPTVHHHFQQAVGDEHMGSSLALLAGSAAYALAQRLLLEADLPEVRFMAANAELVRMQYEVIYGQLFDLVGGASPAVIHRWKTTSYTTQGPVRLGAAIAGCGSQLAPVLAAYAVPLGRAFQIRDDILGVFGDPERLGKPVGSDLRAGKQTDLLRIALSRTDDEGRATLSSVAGRADATNDEIAAACEVIRETGARTLLEGQIAELTERSVQALEDASLRPEGRKFLCGIAYLLAGRQA